MKLPPLNALRVFLVVGSTSSLRRAAQTLCVSHTAVSRQIRELEAWFDAKLVETDSRGTALTLAGRELYDHVRQGFDHLQRGVEAVRKPFSSGQLRIQASPGLATFWILPRLSALQALMPDISVSLMPTERSPSFDLGEVDVAVLYGGLFEERYINEPLFRPRQIVLATRTWIAHHPQVRSVSDLLGVPLIHERQHDWERWFEALGHPVGRRLEGMRVGVLPAALEAVCSGQGPGLFPSMFNIEQSRKELQQVVPDSAAVDSYYVVYERSRKLDPEIMQFREWIRQIEVLEDDAVAGSTF